ncbi:MAG: VOC family protein [Pyrinomonadaceae bacterium]
MRRIIKKYTKGFLSVGIVCYAAVLIVWSGRYTVTSEEKYISSLVLAMDFRSSRITAGILAKKRAYNDGEKASMINTKTSPRLTSLAPQFLVDDLDRSIAYYRDTFGFDFGEPWEGFYAIGLRDGLELHLKTAPKDTEEQDRKHQNEHLDAAVGVDGIETFYEQCVAKGTKIIKPLRSTDWGTKDFYIEDPDGYIISFGGK